MPKFKFPRRRSHAPHVHFHQGPQGQPVPCYDARCANPRLAV
ncbi:MAG TPA: hypothetical protein VF066_17400 [Thermoleophilaceae bacterium]